MSSYIIAFCVVLTLALVSYGHGRSQAAREWRDDAEETMSIARRCIVRLELVRLEAEALGLCEEVVR